MNFKITTGNGAISIGLSEIGSYFSFTHPVSLVWDDCRGSIGKYFCLLPFSEVDRKELQDKIQDNLNTDYTGNTEQLHALLSPLFLLFKNGDYQLDFYNNLEKEFFQYYSTSDSKLVTHYSQLETAFTELTDINLIEQKRKEHSDFVAENAITKKYYPSDILEHTTYNAYHDPSALYATQPDSAIDKERIDFFIQKIKDGERPFAIILTAVYPAWDIHSSYFILDGHHKLLAYQQLNIYPPLCIISHLPKNDTEIEFDAEKLAGLLYPWQTAHLLEHWQTKEPYIIEQLKNPASKLHKFIKNGLVRTYHTNNILKHEGNYINDKPDGIVKEWYKNGVLKYEHCFEKGKKMGVWKAYFPTGKIQFLQPHDDSGQYNGDVIVYYENGRKRWQQNFRNGRNTDGPTHTSWYETGVKEAELVYKDGKMMERRNWVQSGVLVNYEVWDATENKFKKINITASDQQYVKAIDYRTKQTGPGGTDENIYQPVYSKKSYKQSINDFLLFVVIVIMALIALRIIFLFFE